MAEFLTGGGQITPEGYNKPWIQTRRAGVVLGCQVTQASGGANGTVDINPDATTGMGAVLLSTSVNYPWWGFFNAVKNIPAVTADPSNPRWDAVVAYGSLTDVNPALQDNQGALKFKVVQGVAAGSPVIPNAATIQASVGASNPYEILGYNFVAAADSIVNNADITDARRFSAARPGYYLGGLLNTNGHQFQNAADDWVALANGWVASPDTFVYGSNLGQREYTVTCTGDRSGVYCPGQRFKATRSIAPSTQCADFETASTQYAKKTTPTGLSFTDDFEIEFWVKLESYGSVGHVLSRYNGTNGWNLRVNANGSVELYGTNAAAANFRSVLSQQSLPLGRWVHVAAALDMSNYPTVGASNSHIYFDGVLVPANMSTAGTSPTALVQGTGDLEMGSTNAGTATFDGKLADVRLWSAIRTTAQIRDNMNIVLTGSETNLIGYWKLNGNFNDSTSNANNLTAQNAVAATNIDNPMQSTEMAIITKVAFSAGITTLTLFTGTDYNIPNGVLTLASYSPSKTPFGFPGSEDKWYVDALFKASVTQATPSSGVWYNIAGAGLTLPAGVWRLRYMAVVSWSRSAGGTPSEGYSTLSTGSANESESELTCYARYDVGGGTTASMEQSFSREKPVATTIQTPFYLNEKIGSASSSNLTLSGAGAPAVIRAVSGWL